LYQEENTMKDTDYIRFLSHELVGEYCQADNIPTNQSNLNQLVQIKNGLEF